MRPSFISLPLGFQVINTDLLPSCLQVPPNWGKPTILTSVPSQVNTDFLTYIVISSAMLTVCYSVLALQVRIEVETVNSEI